MVKAATSRESLDQRKERARAVMESLRGLYPEAKTSLAWTDPFRLLVATILSAQCMDARVNQVTPALFRRFPNSRAMAQARQEDLEALIRTTGFFRNKAKHLRGAAQAMMERHEGSVPGTMTELLALPGVARKTANCVLGTAFGKSEGVVVDTHVGRLARRMGFSRHTNPVKVELDLMEVFPMKNWVYLSHAWIEHGRAVCTARKAHCANCALAGLCPRRGVKKTS